MEGREKDIFHEVNKYKIRNMDLTVAWNRTPRFPDLH